MCLCGKDSGSKLCGKLVTVQGNKVNAKNNPGARFPSKCAETLTYTPINMHTHIRTQAHAQTHSTVPALCCRIQTNRVNCQKTWHDLSDSLSINREWDWRAFRFSAPSAPPAHSVTPRAQNPPQIITLGGVCAPQDRAKKTWLWSWPILRVLSLLNHPSQGFYYLNNSVTINWKWARSSSCFDIFSYM